MTSASTTVRDPDIDDDAFDEADGALPPRPRRRWLTAPAIALGAVILLAAGFIGGVEVQKGQGGSSSSAASSGLAAARARVFAGGAAGGQGRGAAGGAGGSATTGTVASKHGRTLYVTSGSGTTVRVRTNANTQVTRTASSSVAAIHPGDTVSVTGSKRAGATLASRITATEKGVSAFPAGGFPGGGFGGRGASGGGRGG